MTWTLISSPGYQPIFNASSYTDGNGYAGTSLFQNAQAGSPASPFLQSVIQASVDGLTATFTETMNLTYQGLQLIGARLLSPDFGVTLQGTAGGTGATAIKIHADAFGLAVPNASVRLLNAGDPATTASASCATGTGADPGTVLTDANGDATCNVVFGPVSGNSTINVILGGTDPSAAPDLYSAFGITNATAYWSSFAIPISVKAGIPGMVSISSGNNQTINPGQATSPLTVKVTDASGLNPIGGTSVVWSASPAGSVTFSPASSTSDSQGMASTVATLSSSAVGTITITAALTGSYSNISTTFTIKTNVVLTGLQKVSGDTQTAAAGQAFGQPLVVQVNGSTGGPIAGFTVNFAISGPGTLSSATATTDSTGRAQVNVTAGATAGAVSVTASAGSYSVAFSLTVIPPGPSLSAGGFVNGADFQAGSISPCGIATIMGSGIASTVQGVVTPGTIFGPLPYLLANVKVSFGGGQAPIYNVANVNGQQQVTVQVPCDVTPGTVPVTVNVGGGSATINVTVLPASPGVFLTTMSDGKQRVVAIRPDGSFVSLENPARRGEIIRAYVTGLGSVAPFVGTNSIAVPGTDSVVLGQVIVGVNNAGTRLIGARVAPGLIGVDEVTFQVPSDAPTGNDIVFSVGVNAVGDTQTRFSAGTKIPIL
ncbi:MAG: Ig-like domain-containing protein [Acidobacteria bacterium]|nr:Ig-like domain-containing protein [Acidobacteriota bacterium]